MFCWYCLESVLLLLSSKNCHFQPLYDKMIYVWNPRYNFRKSLDIRLFFEVFYALSTPFVTIFQNMCPSSCVTRFGNNIISQTKPIRAGKKRQDGPRIVNGTTLATFIRCLQLVKMTNSRIWMRGLLSSGWTSARCFTINLIIRLCCTRSRCVSKSRGK